MAAAGDTRAWTGSDAGGKAATIKHMVDTGSGNPSVEYWAEGSDPDGTNHPLIYTARLGPYWIQATSLPYLYASVPLYRALGPSGLLVLPAAGSVLAAVAALALARRLGAESGWGAFWLTGVGSPAAFYSVAAWEHSIALGLFMAAVALALARRRPALASLGAGGLAGLAAVMRTEVLVYGAGIGLALVMAEPGMRRLVRLVPAAAGGALVLLANHLWEHAVVDAGLRSGRVGASVGQSGSELGGRMSDAAVTTIGLFASSRASLLLVGAGAVAGLVALGRAATRRGVFDPLTRTGAALAAALYGVRALDGLGFVPGMLPASPAAAAGLFPGGAGAPEGAVNLRRAISIAAVGVLPAIWFVQWQGQLVPQWGGRYVLISGALLLVVGAVTMEEVGWRRPAPAATAALAVIVTLLGLGWHVERTNGVARALVAIESAPSDTVVVSEIAHLGREAGAFYGDHRWLRAQGETTVAEALAVLKAEHVDRVRFVGFWREGPPALDGYRLQDSQVVGFLGFPLGLWDYERAGS